MKLSKEDHEALILIYEKWWHSYLNGDVKTYDSFLDDDYHFVGSTNNEEFLSRKDSTAFFKATADQLSGKVERRNSVLDIEVLTQDLVMITDLADGYFLSEGNWAFYSRFRFTSLLKRKDIGWRFIYQHFSAPDSKADEGETMGTQKITKENQELKEAIKRRTVELEQKNRELQIETALERIRAQVAAMKDSADLLDIVVTMRTEFVSLGHEAHYFWHMRWLPDHYEKAMTSGDGTRIGMVMTLPRHIHGDIKQVADWEKGKDATHILAMDVNEAVDYVDKMITLGDFEQVDPQAPTLDDVRHIGGLTFVMARTTHGEIGFSLPGKQTNVPKDDLNTLVRFASVFDLAYKRFEDLKAAERQHREAQIELALERVRASAMSMQRPSDLQEVIHTVHQELLKLEITISGGSFIVINREIDREIVCWGSGGTADTSDEIHIPYVDKPFYTNLVNIIKSGPGFFTEEYTQKEKKEFFTFLFQHEPWSKLNDEQKRETLSSPGDYARSCIVSDHTSIFMINHFGQKFSAADNDILKRFGKVFEQAYTRFLDIQKAEAQAREAQIEAALERVRSRSMGMHKSDELKEVVKVIFDQLALLSIDAEHAGIVVDYEPKKDWHFWIAETQDIPAKVTVPYLDLIWDRQYTEAKEQGKDFFTTQLDFEQKNSFYKTLLPHIEGLNKKAKDFYFDCPGLAISTAIQKDIGLYIENFSGSPYSQDENNILRRFASVFQQTYTRFLDLQKAEAQAREARIEGALERVRSKTMAMHNSKDVEGTVITLFDEVLKLGLDKSIRCGIGILEGTEKMETWSANAELNNKVTLRVGLLDMTIHPMLAGLKKAWESGKKGYSYTFTKEDVRIYYEALNNEPDYPFNADLKKLPEKEFHNSYFFSSGIIFAFTENPISEEGNKVLKRFASVFDQTYTRFLDLQKAEAQAREAQIEAALERVRSRSMAMHSSSELADLSMELVKQVQNLGMDNWFCAFNINDEDPKGSLEWGSNGNMVFKAYRTPREGVFLNYYEAGKRGETLLVNEINEEKCSVHYDYLCSLPGVGDQLLQMKAAGIPFPTYQIDHVAYFKYGYLLFITYEPVPESHEIFIRFAKVFEQTYTRFLDLQKAESQAREAQIEAALERVRSRTMAMQHSEELVDVALVLRNEMGALGVEELETSSIYVIDEKTGNTDCWYAIKIDQHTQPKLVTDHMTLRLEETWVGKQMLTFYHSDKVHTSIPMKGDHRKEWIDYCSEHSQILEGFYGEQIPERTYHLNKFSNGFLGAASNGEISDESWMLLERATKVFSLVYTRFRDLQQAEAQAKEALKAASLDRLRAEIASMRYTSDLERIIPLLWRELNTLGIPFIRCGVFIIHEKKKKVHTYLSNPQGESLAVWESDFNATPLIKASVENWKKQEIYLTTWDKEAFISFSNSLVEQGLVKDREKYMSGKEAPEQLVLQMIPFKQGMLYVGSHDKLSEEQLDLVKQTAKAFSVAYARYEDFTHLELAKGSAEKALKDLESAQEQLIQQEKLASLGQLTAGIAHEIKNPLNFVNNFSELSRELIDDVFIELEGLDHSEIKEEVIAILEDVKSNLAKVHEHGTRADGIVTSMLQHSRASGSKREAYDFNALVKEFVNLSYHGMRAGKAPINVKIDLDLGPEVGQVNLISEDFSRVILNLCNNAFDAMRDKLNAKKETDFLPHLTVQTKKQKSKVILSIKDNGPGIPIEIRDKILQPFFTTKKGTEGTGLGLSITHDIIKAHGGELKVETTVGQSGSNREAGTVFNIHLPI